MTPIQKAEELVNKFEPYMPFIDQIDYSINMDKRTRHAKHCALIAVDEILNYIEHMNIEFNLNLSSSDWQEVKQEIEKL